ncbi:Scr1 family TA system antitoxin-like transcriptional regulator [Streptomyces polyrhachis]|uniref:Scr1 family TA system antitoxin-like transcriptional regulator n=1 Tax=Streptomyces polyrhachis TaxID=1282885 RepID=A0ABW2GGV1_9ACTN
MSAPGRALSVVLVDVRGKERVGDAEVMAAQLGRLLTAGALPQVPLGIIPADTPARPTRPLETSHAYDDTLVSAELLMAQVNVTQPSEIALYLKAFEELRQLAVYGAQARGLTRGTAGGLG